MCLQRASAYAEGVMGTGSFCSEGDQERQMLTEATVASPMLLEKRGSPHLFLPPASQIAEVQGTTNGAETDVINFLFLKLILALAAPYKLCF